MHITASVFINDNESGLHEDYDRWLEQVATPIPAAICTTRPAKTTPTASCIWDRGNIFFTTNSTAAGGSGFW
ncbi:hypothetical protein V6x_00790 [Gimesia chilikensis]|uniref:Uncharacterized protein n=1 Tax=Gimesia chilikensis TaxID=2605989 RepID=A0A517W575_9PLAN|nr:hypothetical protein [Gimesia chilikensis]QDU00406.1 hypothetical protein V6x_00790 [Gimesia chilikensis]